jgi:hypothetical protein
LGGAPSPSVLTALAARGFNAPLATGRPEDGFVGGGEGGADGAVSGRGMG